MLFTIYQLHVHKIMSISFTLTVNPVKLSSTVQYHAKRLYLNQYHVSTIIYTHTSINHTTSMYHILSILLTLTLSSYHIHSTIISSINLLHQKACECRYITPTSYKSCQLCTSVSYLLQLSKLIHCPGNKDDRGTPIGRWLLGQAIKMTRRSIKFRWHCPEGQHTPHVHVHIHNFSVQYKQLVALISHM